MTRRTLSNYDDIIDGREILERIEELESEAGACPMCDGSGRNISAACVICEGSGEVPNLDENEQTELKTLQAFAEEVDSVGGDSCRDGATLIRDSYFEFYAQELAEDIGAIDHDATWPNNCIDWEYAARELQYDYSTVDFDGVNYWVRS